MILVALSALTLQSAPIPISQDPPAPPETPAASTPLPDVVVEHRPLEEVVRSFVDEVADPLPGYGPARWDRNVCVRVAYLRRELAQFMVNRISEVAREVGLRPGAAGCRPNVLIIAAGDGQEMSRALVEARSGLFLTNVSGANRTRAELEAFQSTDAPVRWWHISLPVNAAGQAAVRLPGGPPGASAGETGSRLRTELQNDLQRVFIVVDVNRASGHSIGQLSDYVAMVALAQVDPEADTSGYDTILNLFDGPAPPPEATGWDRAYLNALYGTHLDQRQPNAQLAAIARVMARNRREPAADVR